MKRFKKLKISLIFLLLFLTISTLTNPTIEDFIKFDEVQSSLPIPEDMQIIEADFYLFSIYSISPAYTYDEYGKVFVGFMGGFYQSGVDQYDRTIFRSLLRMRNNN